ncbi:MAG: cytochrome P450, partial [Aureispira sp.]|nr:cytochrome P450 [Aureispira sp.]
MKPWYYVNGAIKENKRLKKEREDIIINFIEERKQSGKKVDDLLDMLIETEYEDGSKMTNQQLLDETVILLIAGHETSAITMSWTWYLLCGHPEIEEKLLDSVMENLGDKDP